MEYADRVENLRRLLERLRLSDQQMQVAMAKFAPDFARDAFVEAWKSEDPALRNDAHSVRANADDIHNAVMLLLNTAGRTARTIGELTTRPNEQIVDALQRAGKVTKAERDSLDFTKAIRDRSQHDYADLDPGEVHDMVTSQSKTAIGLIARIAQWIDTWASPETPD